MALSGSFSGSIRSGNYKLRVDWSATQNVTNNTSKITCTMYLVQASSWSLNIASRTGNTTSIAGTSHSWTSPAINNSGGKTTKLGSVTSGNITHNADGSKSVTISATFKIQATISGTRYETITASDTVTLNTIPRATQPTVSSSSVNMGSIVTISTPRASSSFTHDLSYKFAGSSWYSIATGVGNLMGWTVPDLASRIPNATSGTVTIRCITKSGGTSIGTKTVLLTAKVPTSVVPTISSVTATEATSGLAAQFGAFIQGKSKIAAKITAAGAKGSTIKKYSTTFSGTTYTGASWTSPTVSKSGTLSLVTTVTDSRGRTAKKTTNITVLAYKKPFVTEFEVRRVNDDGLADHNGAKASVAYDYSVASLGGKNTAAMAISYKRSTATTWSDPVATGSDLEGSGVRLLSGTFSTDYQYDWRITVTDWFGSSSTYTTVMPSGAVILDLKADGKGIGVGKTSEKEGVEIAWPTTFSNNRVLWSGSSDMSTGQTATLSSKVSEQTNGIVLVFSRYSSSTTQNYHFNHFFVHKSFVAAHPGAGSQFLMTTDGSLSVIATKYLYINDGSITGNANNGESGTANGITYNNAGFVLRYVIGV